MLVQTGTMNNLGRPTALGFPGSGRRKLGHRILSLGFWVGIGR